MTAENELLSMGYIGRDQFGEGKNDARNSLQIMLFRPALFAGVDLLTPRQIGKVGKPLAMW